MVPRQAGRFFKSLRVFERAHNDRSLIFSRDDTRGMSVTNLLHCLVQMSANMSTGESVHDGAASMCFQFTRRQDSRPWLG